MHSTIVLNQIPIEILDENGNKVKISKEGNTFLVSVRDEEQLSLLTKIYSELKKLNFHMENISDMEVDDLDIIGD